MTLMRLHRRTAAMSLLQPCEYNGHALSSAELGLRIEINDQRSGQLAARTMRVLDLPSCQHATYYRRVKRCVSYDEPQSVDNGHTARAPNSCILHGDMAPRHCRPRQRAAHQDMALLLQRIAWATDDAKGHEAPGLHRQSCSHTTRQTDRQRGREAWA